MSASSGVAVRKRSDDAVVQDAVVRIDQFIRSCREPALIEPGEDPFALAPGLFSLERTARGITFACWDRERTLTRRIASVAEPKHGQMALVTERFGKKAGSATIADLAVRPDAVRDGLRLKFREQFRRMLARQFAGWRIAEVSTGADLEHSLSPAYSRALLTRGPSCYAAIGAPLDSNDPDGALTFGLIWLDYLRRRMPDRYVEGLAVFVPDCASRVTCDRVRHLRGAQFQVFGHSSEGGEAKLDLADFGNFQTKVEPCVSTAPLPAWLSPVLGMPGVDAVMRPSGGLSVRVRGLEFLRVSGGWVSGAHIAFGIDKLRPATEMHAAEILSLARHLAEVRQPEGDSANPLFRRFPEAWLDSQARAAIDRIDANLEASPVYGQAPAFAAGDRGMIDLLAVDRDGRLAVIELKASADIHLPLQALDYWMRVTWHLERREFSAAGYFPGTALRREPPKLYLVAPALEFHPANETVLRYFSSAIQVERVGLSLEWRQRLRVICRSGETTSFHGSSFKGTPFRSRAITEQHVFRRPQGDSLGDLKSESG